MRLALILLCGLCLSACENIWFKPGTNNDDLAVDKAACGSGVTQPGVDPGEREQRFEECMAARGWWHSGAANGQPKTRGQDTTRVATSAPAVPASRSEPTKPAPTTVGTSAVDPREGEDDRSAPSTAPIATGSASAPDPAGEHPGNLSQSWWKRGGRVDDLGRDQKHCREKSGVDLPADTPYRWGESERFDQCMRDIGWRGP